MKKTFYKYCLFTARNSIETKLNELKPISSTNMLAVYSRLKYAFMITFHL